MRVTAYAEVYSPETHPHIASCRPTDRPVPTLAELVADYGGYAFTTPLSRSASGWMARVAEATGDTALADIIARGYIAGSFEPLAHLDHATTMVVYGVRIEPEPTDPPELLPPPDPDFHLRKAP
ncbi:hypothetical protein [Nonomuraea angiospora]